MHRPGLQRLYEWAVALEREGLASLSTYHGVDRRWTLLPRLLTEKAGLVTVWNEGGASLQVWRSVFERRAPESLPRVEQIAPVRVGQGAPVRSATSCSRRSAQLRGAPRPNPAVTRALPPRPLSVADERGTLRQSP